MTVSCHSHFVRGSAAEVKWSDHLLLACVTLVGQVTRQQWLYLHHKPFVPGLTGAECQSDIVHVLMQQIGDSCLIVRNNADNEARRHRRATRPVDGNVSVHLTDAHEITDKAVV